MHAHVFNAYALRSASTLLVCARYVLNYTYVWFKFRILAGTFFPTYVVDDLAALVLDLGFQTKWFGLSYDIKHVCTTSPISCMILYMPRLSIANENSHNCVTLSVDSEYVIFI